jgi:hypothetical protein
MSTWVTPNRRVSSIRILYLQLASLTVGAFLAGACPAMAEPPPPPPLIVSGTPAVVAPPGFRQHGRTFTFHLRAANQDVSSVVIAGSGLGNATFRTEQQVATRFITIPKVTTTPIAVTVTVPEEAFPGGSVSAPAKLTIWTPTAALEVPLLLGASALLAPFSWFLAVVLPALLTAVLAYGGFRLQEAVKQRAVDRKAREETLRAHSSEIDRYFANLYRTTWETWGKNPATWARQVKSDLDQRWLAGVSTADLEKLKEAFASADPMRVTYVLSSLFPKRKASIQAIHDIVPGEEP